MANLTEEIFKKVLQKTFTDPPPSFPVLVTDWGIITMPDDMKGLCRIRRDGQPDKRFKTAAVWHQRFREETEKLSTAYGS